MAALALLGTAMSAPAQTGFFRIEDVRPGMKGVGRTCYQGTTPEEFQVEILGVLHGMNPGASAVLARFSGGVIDRVGVFEGMSGSPVFINGKLLGAVAFTYAFAKEAIGGITPITQMVEAFEQPPSGSRVIMNRSAFQGIRLPLPSKKQDWSGELEATAQRLRLSMPALSGGHSLIPIATPVSFGGLANETLKAFAPQFRAMGMSVLQGAGGKSPAKAKGSADTGRLEPGSNLVVPLVRGDLDVSAGGTVTHVDGNRVYAFGHNLLDLGFTDLPMHTGRAITIFPSLESSFKIMETGELVGSIRQDRGSGIYGILGEKPRMVPLSIRLTTSRGATKQYLYELARDPFLTPLLVNLTVYNTIVTSERAQGAVTLRIKGTINVKGEQDIILDNRFSSDSDAPTSASLSIAVPVNYLMTAGYRDLDLEKIDLEITAEEDDRSAILDSIRLTRNRVKAGEKLQLEVSYKRINGEVIQASYPIQVPESASPGPLTLLVSDGATLTTLDEKEEGENLIPRDLTQLVKFINHLRKNDHLYVRFFRREPGALVRGEGLPGLPPSILSILKSDRKAGAMTLINTSVLMEYEMPRTEYMVAGAKTLKLEVIP